MSSPVSWNLRLSVHDGKLDDARTLMGEMVAATRNEPGTVGYEWFLSNDGTTCHIHERYADSEAAIAHLQNFGANFAERFLQCFGVQGLVVYGEPSDAARGIMDGFGAEYLGTFGGFSR